MKTFLMPMLLLAASITLVGCRNSTSSSDKPSEVLRRGRMDSSYLLAKVDSTISLDGSNYHLSLSQYDLTEIATAHGDTLQRPTYACTIDITDDGGTLLFSDSVLRDSWGYPGRIAPIEAYQINFPNLHYHENEIILIFKIYELSDGDSIDGIITFNVVTKESRYHWKESMAVESFGVMP